MAELIGSLYLASTLAFGIAASAAGLHLIALARRNGQRPEMLLGARAPADRGPRLHGDDAVDRGANRRVPRPTSHC